MTSSTEHDDRQLLEQAALAFQMPIPDWQAVDALEEFMRSEEQTHCPVDHAFTKGLYSRTIFMPAGTLVVSKIHLTQHQYVVSTGKVRVWTREHGVIHIEAPHVGITEPLTRRVLFIEEDTVWTTFHPTDETDVAKIEEQIILKRPSTDTILCPGSQ